MRCVTMTIRTTCGYCGQVTAMGDLVAHLKYVHEHLWLEQNPQDNNVWWLNRNATDANMVTYEPCRNEPSVTRGA